MCGVTNVRDALADDLRPNRSLVARIDRGELGGARLQQSVLVSQRGGTFAPAQSSSERVFAWLTDVPFVAPGAPESGVVVFDPSASAIEVRDAVDRAIDERGAGAIKLYDQREKKLSYAPGATLMSQAQLDAATDQARRRGVPSTDSGSE